MLEFLVDALPVIGSVVAWVVTICLLIVGFAGTLVPFLPGHLILFFAAFAHWLMLREDSGVEWWTFVVLGLLLTLSQVFEFMSGAVGTRWFGGTRWGAAGALIGGIVGMFFMPFGLILGPLIGSMLCEFVFAKKEVRPATVSGVGSVLGTVAGLVVKVVVGVLMIIWFVVDVIWI
ncbi:MAG: DUF456 domain-containing protein [Verrucomicrobiae bacterium]|nr:DUF456 domain-containing protein [Verrucomicrobiae bacterium]NNJ85592.1 DUF456 domain-containing protein [Akkermansiaceae bacterium]